MSNRLAVDIGGTFTDVVLETGGRTFATKVLTTLHAAHYSFSCFRGIPDAHMLTAIGNWLFQYSLSHVLIRGATIGASAI